MKSTLIALSLFLCSGTFFAQETETNTLESQFDKIYRISTNYQVYKVISKESFQKLKIEVLDSINTAKKRFLAKENQLEIEKNNYKATQLKLKTAQSNLEIALKKENTIALFGLQLSKVSYNLILWLLITTLLAGLLYFVYKFNNSNVLTKEAEDNLEVVEQEFEQHRKKGLESEQKLRRKLQDEINKQRN
jgi:ABC-type multidrug transport system permease subunit